MGKLTLSKKKGYLSGHSLLEVIVSTVIITVGLLTFSYLLGQLFTSRRLIPEGNLMMANYGIDQANGTVDTHTVKRIFNDISLRIEDQPLGPADILTLKILDKSTERVLFRYNSLPHLDTTIDIFTH